MIEENKKINFLIKKISDISEKYINNMECCKKIIEDINKTFKEVKKIINEYKKIITTKKDSLDRFYNHLKNTSKDDKIVEKTKFVIYEKNLINFRRNNIEIKKLEDIQEEFLKNYYHIQNNELEIIKHYNELEESFQYYINDRLDYYEIIEDNNDMITYILNENISIPFFRKLILIDMYKNFMKNYQEKFKDNNDKNECDFFNILATIDFSTEQNWIAKNTNLYSMRINSNFKYYDFLILINKIEEKISELEERYDILKWNRIKIVIV